MKYWNCKCLKGSWSLDFGGNDYKTFGLDGHTFDRRWTFFYKEGWYKLQYFHYNFYLKPKVIVITRIFTLFYWSSHWRCSLKEPIHKKLCQFQMKTPVLESLFNKVAGLRAFCAIFANLFYKNIDSFFFVNFLFMK